MTTGRAMVSGSASPVGSGPSQLVTSWDCTSGYRTPDRPRGFIRCFERKEPEQVVKRRQSTSSIDKLSHEALLAPARELRRMSLAPPVDAEKAQKELEETKNLLEKCMSDLADQKMYDQMLEKFRPFLTALSRAEQLLRREQPETLLGFLEPKELLLALPMLQRRRVSKIPEPDLLKVVEAPSPPVISPTRRAAVEADAKVMREKRLRRATRRPEESLEDLLIKSRDQAEALDYAAGGDSDEVQVAFETFHRAVRQAFEKKAAAKGRLSLEGFEPKPQMAAFLVDVGVKRKAWRSRVFYVLTKLLELKAWQEHLQGSEVQWFLDAQSPGQSPIEVLSPSVGSPHHSEPEPEQSAQQLQVKPTAGMAGLSPTQVEESEQKAPWYVKVCFSLLGVDRTLRFCKCLVPRDIHQLAGLLLTRVVPCPHLELEQLGYESTGFRGQGLRGSTKEVYQERSFNSNGSLTHCYAAPGDGTSAAFPTERKHDISFWISPDFTEELLLRCFSSTAGRLNGLQPEAFRHQQHQMHYSGCVEAPLQRPARTPHAGSFSGAEKIAEENVRTVQKLSETHSPSSG
ncbi:unnamed protein product [Cladocopium goreaui]|uniref:25S rRNA (Uridine-N(3))-methyltransferase BMT5-like domain-containing protein n=1 Tax=Cladocopium goreaui TaxID=2562237 RepID=A0A9P1CFR2_9DINO|nr:unnamed protein product [Cladocopium goreaui]